MAIVRLSPDCPGASVARYIVCQYEGGSARGSIEVAEKSPACRSTPQVKDALEWIGKSAVGAGAVSTSHYVDDLVPYLNSEAFALLQTLNGVYARLVPLFSDRPFRSRSPKEAGGGAGAAWVGEGKPIPNQAISSGSVTLEPFKASIILPVTKEVIRFGLNAERFLARSVGMAVNRFIDDQLLNPAITATTSRPASLTSLGNAVSSTGSTAAQITADFGSLVAATDSPLDNARIVCRPQTYFTICARLAGVGLNVTPGFLFGIPVIMSSTCPRIVALIDCDTIANATDRAVAVEVSNVTSLEMSDSPTQDALAGTGTTSMVSMLQSGLVGIKATLTASWLPSHDAAGSPAQAAGISYMSVTY